jgi:hypothetical protein
MLAEVTGRIGSEVEQGPSGWLNYLFNALHCMIPKAPGCCFLLFGCFSLLAKKKAMVARLRFFLFSAHDETRYKTMRDWLRIVSI